MQKTRTYHKSKIPLIEQMNQYECGICCLNMILDYYYYKISMQELRKYFGNGRDGIDLLNIKQVAEQKGLNCKALRISVDRLVEENYSIPAIAFYEDKHFVVIEKIKNRKFYILDPALGRLRLDGDEFQKKYSGIILFLWPGDSFQRRKEKRDFSWRKMLVDHKPILITILLFSLLLQGVSVGIPIVIKTAIDSIVTNNNPNLLRVFTIIFVLVIAIQVLLTTFKSYVLVKLQNKLDFSLMDRFIDHLLKLPYSFFELRARGDLIYRANSNIRIREFLSQNLITSIINVFLVVVIFAYMVIESPLLAFTILGIGILQILIVSITKNKLRYLTQAEITNQTNTSSYMTEVLSGVSTVKSLGIEKNIYDKWAVLFNRQIGSMRRKEFFKLKVDTMTNMLHFSAPVIVILLGIYQVMNGDITIGTLFAFQSLCMSFLTPLNSIVMLVSDLITIETLMDRINDILKTDKEDNQGKNKVEMLKGNIKLENVSFKYHDYGENVIDNVSLNINQGQKVGIVGKSGSGKSTLASLLVGLYSPTSGDIYFDNNNYKEIDKSSFRREIGVVLQDNFLFNKTVYENITVHKPEASREDVFWAATCAALDEDLRMMPMGFSTIVSETGSNFSGGQKQRIALARALVGKPAILLLDEATSALDSITERKIEKSIQSLNCTRVVIAHRLSTIINSDKIIVLDQGKVIAEGPHEELLEKCEYYRELYHTSFESHAEAYC